MTEENERKCIDSLQYALHNIFMLHSSEMRRTGAKSTVNW